MYENLLANVPTDLWIGGKWRKASDGGRFDVLDPATENKIASVASATVEDAKAAVDAASDAFEGWAARKPRERAVQITTAISTHGPEQARRQRRRIGPERFDGTRGEGPRHELAEAVMRAAVVGEHDPAIPTPQWTVADFE